MAREGKSGETAEGVDLLLSPLAESATSTIVIYAQF